MNIKKWSIDHTKGVLLSIITPLIFLPLVLYLFSYFQGYYFEQLWYKLMNNSSYQIKMLTISIISNLGWFYLFLNKEIYDIAMGIIIGSLMFAPYIIFIKFI